MMAVVHSDVVNATYWNITPLLHGVLYITRSAKILILISEWIIKQISYERRDYESVDEKSIF